MVHLYAIYALTGSVAVLTVSRGDQFKRFRIFADESSDDVHLVDARPNGILELCVAVGIRHPELHYRMQWQQETQPVLEEDCFLNQCQT